MKNIEAGVGVIHIQEKKEEVEEEKNKEVTNIVRFYLKDDPRFEMSAMGLWRENSSGKKVRYVDIYFRHIMTGERCESAWECLIGWSDDEWTEEIWETLCMRIEELDGLEEIICDEESFGV